MHRWWNNLWIVTVIELCICSPFCLCSLTIYCSSNCYCIRYTYRDNHVNHSLLPDRPTSRPLLVIPLGSLSPIPILPTTFLQREMREMSWWGPSSSSSLSFGLGRLDRRRSLWLSRVRRGWAGYLQYFRSEEEMVACEHGFHVHRA